MLIGLAVLIVVFGGSFIAVLIAGMGAIAQFNDIDKNYNSLSPDNKFSMYSDSVPQDIQHFWSVLKKHNAKTVCIVEASKTDPAENTISVYDCNNDFDNNWFWLTCRNSAQPVSMGLGKHETIAEYYKAWRQPTKFSNEIGSNLSS